MKSIPVEYFFEGKPYRFNSELFDSSNIYAYTEHLQKRYSNFAEKIIAEKGRLEINLSHSPDLLNGIRYQTQVKGVSPELLSQIDFAVKDAL